MLYKKVRIESFAYELPETVVTSLALEEQLAPVYQKLGRSFGRLEMMTGIRERRFWDADTPPSRFSTRAAEKAIAASGIDKSHIECLLHTSVSRDFLEPATAFVVHDSLGLPPTALIFDISNACIGFINGMITLANMIELGQVTAGIVVGGESSRRLAEATIHQLLTDPTVSRAKLKDGFASLTLGSGAVAAVLTHASISKSGHRLVGGVVRTASEHNGLCRVDKDTCFFDPESYPNMHADFQGILKNGLGLVSETWKAFSKELRWRIQDIDKVFSHQVSTVHHELLFRTLGIDTSKGFTTVESLGNIGSCSLPISLAIGIEQGRLDPGDRVVMMAAGSGLSSIMLGVKW
ncbi:MAG: 3-oxoacyl-ACP synthase III [Dehalococcoidia bacterium]|nr:3-oxoacyl-ACP synthase III [Dehalococcoidia bacterium]